jgi:flagellar hook-length control protein FliK
MSANGAFANLLAGMTSGANLATGASQDLLSQLASLVQNGTPLSSIVDRIAQSVGNAVQQKLAGTLPQNDLDRIRSSITTSIANALAPPGNAPPGTPEQQVSALATRLQRLIESLARDSAGTGQQNDIAGKILDAKSAKDIPAQAPAKETASTLDVSSLVRSLLSGAVAALQQAAPATSASAPQSSTPQPATPGDNANALLSQSNASLPQQPIKMANAPDLLARMLVRAAGVDAKINGAAAGATGSAGTTSDGAQTPSALAARFGAALANIVSNASQASSNGSFTGGQTGQSFDQQLSSQPSSTHDSSLSNTLAAPGFTVTSPVQNLAQTTAAVSPAGVDANAVIEQLVKSMAMRTNAQGSSEIRLHLQPENLGDVTMKITVTGSQISANVVAANADVRNALMSNHQQLARSLADAGLTLSGFSVDVSGGNAGHDRQNNDRTAGFGRRYTVHELPGASTSETTDIASLGPPLLSGSNLALFNYLA